MNKSGISLSSDTKLFSYSDIVVGNNMSDSTIIPHRRQPYTKNICSSDTNLEYNILSDLPLDGLMLNGSGYHGDISDTSSILL